MDDAMKWMNNGLAVVLVVGGCIAGWFVLKMIVAGVKHLFAHVVVPLKDAGIEHLKQTTEAMKSNEQTNREISSQLQKVGHRVQTIGADVVEIKTGMQQWNE